MTFNNKTHLPFRAAWPKSEPLKNKSLINNVLKFAFFPAYAAYLGIKRFGNWCVHPASSPYYADLRDVVRKWKKYLELKKWYEATCPKTKIESCSLFTPDGVELDGLLVRSLTHHPHTKKALIYIGGARKSYEQYMQEFITFVRESVDPDITIFFVNPRGVGLSDGKSLPEKLPLDIYSAYEYLIHKHHFDPNDIGLYGFSLGGGIGAVGAALVQEKYPKAKIGMINERSFSSISDVVQHWCGNGKLAKLAVKVIHGLDLDIPAAEAWEKLKGHKVIFCDARDRVVPFEASLFNAVDVGHRIQIGEHEESRAFDYHFDDWWTDETMRHLIAEQLRKMLHIKEAG